MPHQYDESPRSAPGTDNTVWEKDMSSDYADSPHPISSTRREMTRAGSGKGLKILGLLLILLLVAACAGKKAPAAPKLVLLVHPQRSVNKGQIFYMVIKEVDEKRFNKDTYQDVASLVTADDPGSYVLGIHPVIPGKQQKIYMDKPGEMSLGLYFLFTVFRDDWKRRIPPPLTGKYRITIENETIDISERQASWLPF